MSTFKEVAGTIVFTDNKAKREAAEILIDGDWARIIEVDGKDFLAGVNGEGEPIDEEYALTSMEDNTISFCYGQQRNIQNFLNKLFNEFSSRIDTELSELKVVNYDGTFALSKYSGGSYETLSDEETEEIIGMKISDIDYEDEESETFYITAIERADIWLIN